MKTHLLSPLVALLLLAGCNPKPETRQNDRISHLPYPNTRMDSTQDNYFGTIVKDPYRWLENDTSAGVMNWVQEENKVTMDYLSKIPFRDKIRKRLEEIWNYERYSVPFKEGNSFYFYKNNGLQNQSVLYTIGENGSENEFFDPNKLSREGTVALGVVAFSKDGSKMGYAINRAGSDWQEIYVYDAEKHTNLSDSLQWVKFSDIAWQGNGFYYSRFDKPSTGSAMTSQNQNQKVYFHKIGTPQSADKLIYSDPQHPLRGFGAGTTEDEHFLLIYGSEGAATGNSLYYRDLQKPGQEIKKVFDGFEYNYTVIDNIGSKLLVMTNKNAPRYQLVMVDPANPAEENWTTVIPEGKNVLQSVTRAGGKLFAIYMQDAANHLYQYDESGKLEHEVNLPAIGTVSGISGKPDAKDIFYIFTSFTFPTTVYKYEVASGKSDIWKQPSVKFNPADYETRQVFYTSKDGTKVPMFIVHKKGLKMDGNNPTYLYGYGGFDISLNPSFSVSRLILLENGGVFAMPSLRGGGEYGEEWHKAGMLEKKQNVFNDFIAAAEYLIANKYTSSEKLAIAGGSNGGLLVGATMTQRPDLMKVAFPAVGVLDMLRYHKFTIGHAWSPEYGSSDSAEQFKYLIKYSPLHNVHDTTYPATLITTADHDDRVVPAHSFKFAATLQKHNKGDNPILIRIDHNAGHGAGKPTQKQIDEWTDIWSFFFYNMGVAL
jgi:prolyl oligopeptidase